MIAMLFNFGGEVRLVWDSGHYSGSSYTLEQATFQLDHFSGYSHALIKGGLLDGFKVY
tara:strand:- start:755 stop:928 length:174 start_codon:yes stop_codon:yes gene_type:complete